MTLGHFDDLKSLRNVCLVYPNVSDVYSANRYNIIEKIISNRLLKCRWRFGTTEQRLNWVKDQTETYHQCFSFDDMDIVEEDEWFWDSDYSYFKGGTSLVLDSTLKIRSCVQT